MEDTRDRPKSTSLKIHTIVFTISFRDKENRKLSESVAINVNHTFKNKFSPMT